MSYWRNECPVRGFGGGEGGGQRRRCGLRPSFAEATAGAEAQVRLRPPGPEAPRRVRGVLEVLVPDVQGGGVI